MRTKETIRLVEIIEEQREDVEKNCEALRQKTKEQILKIQEENRRTYNLRRKKPNGYRIGDFVAIKRIRV